MNQQRLVFALLFGTLFGTIYANIIPELEILLTTDVLSKILINLKDPGVQLQLGLIIIFTIIGYCLLGIDTEDK